MAKIYLHTLLLLVCGFLAACSSEPMFTFGFGDDNVRDSVIQALEEKKIWYQTESDGKITIYKKDMLLVEKLGEEASEKIIPSGRSVKVNKYAQPDILKALDIAKVKYRIVTYGTKSLPPYADEVGMSAEFIVFEEGHEVKGFKVVSEFNRSMNPGKYLYKNQASQP